MSTKKDVRKVVYRGYRIHNSTLNRLWWVSKGGFGVCWADSLQDAKGRIDALLAKQVSV